MLAMMAAVTCAEDGNKADKCMTKTIRAVALSATALLPVSTLRTAPVRHFTAKAALNLIHAKAGLRHGT